MDGFAQGLLAGFSTVDNAMQQRKALGLREAALAQQQKNADRNYQLAADRFSYEQETGDRDYKHTLEREKVDDDFKNRDFGLRQSGLNARVGIARQQLAMQKKESDYKLHRQEYNDMLTDSQPAVQGFITSAQNKDYDGMMAFYNQIPEKHPIRKMVRPEYAESTMNAANGIKDIIQGHPDDAIKNLNKPEMLKNLSATFSPELQQRIGMKDPTTGKTITDAQIGAILPSPDGMGVVLGLDLTYDDGSKSHKPVTEYGSADPRDSNVLNLRGDKAIDLILGRSDFSQWASRAVSAYQPQGLSLAEQQKIAGNSAAGAARAGNDPGLAFNSMMGDAFGHKENQQKAQQIQATNTANSWAGDDPIKKEFVSVMLRNNPAVFTPGNEDDLRKSYQNFTKKNTNTQKALKDTSASGWAGQLRYQREQQQNKDFLYGSD
ncbi:hypothetical protein AABH71_004908 [Salmonella enterica]|uniref:hypothetical protein n=1 Tax=Salmonella enterica TaxID=28901 RepID=UPI0012D4F366|nr:hypothetical protein [Salmonella enterica]EBQ9004199.1 hypothetical protein [Salmonella enterica subsp. enterica serovar Blockley]ECU7995128.1 hypothetical protein [Salmonella enterica subsp. enterica serovar Toucra]ECW2124490.1 hypothetical protein [Salmonella enterica]